MRANWSRVARLSLVIVFVMIIFSQKVLTEGIYDYLLKDEDLIAAGIDEDFTYLIVKTDDEFQFRRLNRSFENIIETKKLTTPYKNIFRFEFEGFPGSIKLTTKSIEFRTNLGELFFMVDRID